MAVLCGSLMFFAVLSLLLVCVVIFKWCWVEELLRKWAEEFLRQEFGKAELISVESCTLRWGPKYNVVLEIRNARVGEGSPAMIATIARRMVFC